MNTIPKGWKKIKLGELLAEKPKYGIGAAAVSYSLELPTYLRITDIDSNGRFNPKEKVSLVDSEYTNYILKENELVFARTGATVGKSYLYNKDDGELIYAGFLIKVRPDTDKLNSEFLKFYVNGEFYWNWVRIMSVRSGQPGINANEYSLLPVILPPLEEQQKISDILKTWDNSVKKQELLIDKKKELKKYLINKLLYGKHTKEWDFVRLGNLLEYEQPTKYLVSSTNYDNSFNTPVLTAGKTFILGFTNEKEGIFKEKLPVIIFDDFTTANKFVDFPFKAKSSAMKILKVKNEDINIKLVYELMQTIRFLSDDHKRYWISEYQELEIKVPPKNEQDRIMAILNLADKELMLLKEKLHELKLQKDGLMQKLLTGKLRVKV